MCIATIQHIHTCSTAWVAYTHACKYVTLFRVINCRSLVLLYSFIYRQAVQNKPVPSKQPVFYPSLNDSDEEEEEEVTGNGSCVETHKGNHEYNLIDSKRPSIMWHMFSV